MFWRKFNFIKNIVSVGSTIHFPPATEKPGREIIILQVYLIYQMF